MDTLKRNHERQPERKVLGCVVSRIGGRSRFFWGQNMFPEDKSRRVYSTHLKNNSQIGSFSRVEVKVKIFETSTQSLYIKSNPSKHKTCSGQGNSIESPSFFLVYTFKIPHEIHLQIFRVAIPCWFAWRASNAQCGRYQEAVAGQLALSEAHVFHPQFSMPHVFLGAI